MCKWNKIREYMKGATQKHTIVPVQGENDTRDNENNKMKKNGTNAHMYVISTYKHWFDMYCTASAGAVNIQSPYKL